MLIIVIFGAGLGGLKLSEELKTSHYLPVDEMNLIAAVDVQKIASEFKEKELNHQE